MAAPGGLGAHHAHRAAGPVLAAQLHAHLSAGIERQVEPGLGLKARQRDLDHIEHEDPRGAVDDEPELRRRTQRMALVAPQGMAGRCGSIQQRQHAPKLGLVVDRPEQRLAATVQLVEDLGALVEEMVQQVGSHDRVVGREVAARRQLELGQGQFKEIAVEVSAGRTAAVGAPEPRAGRLQVQPGSDGRRAIGAVVGSHRCAAESLETQQRFIQIDLARMHRDDQMPRVEHLDAVLARELHQRKQQATAGSAKLGMHGQRRDLRDLPRLAAHRIEIEGALHREAEHALADDGDGTDEPALPAGAQRRCRRQCMEGRDAQARRMGCHIATGDIGIVQQPEAGFQLLARLGQLELQAQVRVGIAGHQRTVHRGACPCRQAGQHAAQRPMKPVLPGRWCGHARGEVHGDGFPVVDGCPGPPRRGGGR
mmetsp:Transcript_21035/g.81315  ORF Transcript_21035/g.81315 Transcript_21035/m.81315 type:complete len:424 (-) Transcript_21035:528-1799(-)